MPLRPVTPPSSGNKIVVNRTGAVVSVGSISNPVQTTPRNVQMRNVSRTGTMQIKNDSGNSTFSLNIESLSTLFRLFRIIRIIN